MLEDRKGSERRRRRRHASVARRLQDHVPVVPDVERLRQLAVHEHVAVACRAARAGERARDQRLPHARAGQATTTRPCLCWYCITAPRVITLARPGRQSRCSSGRVLEAPAEVPGRGVRAATSCAPVEIVATEVPASSRAAGSRAGRVVAGVAASPGGTPVEPADERRAGLAREVDGAWQRDVHVRTQREAEPARAEGERTRVDQRHLPGSAGEMRGRRVPSTELTAFENVSVNSRFGPISSPGEGSASTAGRAGPKPT